jgi:hypothetical protein
MAKPANGKRKSLKQHCWSIHLTVTALAAELGLARWTVYDAWANPGKYPKAAPRIFSRLGL